VGLSWSDDGWVAAHLALSGREVCWHAPTDPAPVVALLARLGLPPLTREAPEAWLELDLRLRLEASAAVQAAEADDASEAAVPWKPLPPVEGPLTSIIMCTFNRAHLIEEALASARIQTRSREIVIVDDGSDDGTPELLAPLDGVDGIRVIRQENTGKPGALARGLAEARGDYLVVLDDDDVMLPGALHVLAKALDDDPELGTVYGDTGIVRDHSGKVVGHQSGIRLPAALMPASTLMQVPCMPGACLIRRSAHDAAGDYDPELVRGEDMDLFLRLARAVPMRSLPLTTFLWREHGGLRGKADDRWRRRDRAANEARFNKIVQAVFRRRWQELRTDSRLEGHAWAVGLNLRDLKTEALQELKRWKAPWTPAEAAFRGRVGLKTKPRRPKETLIVVDDGDPGSLEALLHSEAEGREVKVCLEVHREPLGWVKLFWPGDYRAQEFPRDWVRGPTHLRLSSAPDWRPPPLQSLRNFPPISATSALAALTAVEGWEQPVRTRPGLRWNPQPIALAAMTARAALSAGNGQAAIQAILPVCEGLPSWAGGWALAAEAFTSLGLLDEAQECLRHAS